MNLEDFPFDPRDPAWGQPLWPQWVTEFRDHQIIAMVDAVTAYENGADVVIMDAPTGSGKTIIAEGIRRLLDVREALYVANTNSLVDQFHSDFKAYARRLKGRSNYPTLDNPAAFNHSDRWGNPDGLSCGDCDTKMTTLPACSGCDPEIVTLAPVPHCSNCHPMGKCPYKLAKIAAVGDRKSQTPGAPVAVTNTSYFVTEANGPGALHGRPFVVIDECDTLESILMSQIEVFISAKRMEKLGIEPPSRKTVEEAWLPWAEDECLPKVKAAKEAIQKKVKGKKDVSTKERREKESLERLYASVQMLVNQLKVGNAVYDGYEKGDVHFKPIRVDGVAPDKLWKHGKKWLLMSATIIDPTEFVTSVGVEEAGLEWEIVTVPSTFPPENRPIIVKPVANMVWKEKETAWPEMIEGIRWAIDRHPEDRVLVHTVSYAFSKYCQERLTGTGRTIMTYTRANEREAALARFKRVPGAVLLASSMDRGIDLPEDDCRVVIVTKMPFLSLKDKQVQKRMYSPGGQLWYQVQTLRILVQMTGRHVRSATDVGYTYILDKQFANNVWKSGKRLLPAWWKDSIDWTGGR